MYCLRSGQQLGQTKYGYVCNMTLKSYFWSRTTTVTTINYTVIRNLLAQKPFEWIIFLIFP